MIDIVLNLQSELRKYNGYQITDIKDVGSDIMINCPFHAEGRERTPSFGILKEDKYTAKGKLDKGYGNCFACGQRMSIDKLVQAVLPMSEEDSELWLKTNGYTAQVNSLYETLTNFSKEEDRIVIPDNQYTKGYTDYMVKRGITDKSARIFDLGYTNNSMVIPIKDRHGKTRMLIHRFINPINDRKFHNTAGANKDELLHGRWELLQHPQKLANKYLFVVESSIDMILLWQYGYSAVATMQATPTNSQIEQIKQLPFENIVIATDNDIAGNKAVERYLKEIKDKNLFRLKYLEHENDIGDLTQERMRCLVIVQIQRAKQKIPFENISLG